MTFSSIAAIIPSRSIRWLYVDFNSYFASVEQQLQPTLRGKPIVIVPVETDATCAIAASYEAKAFGIRTGTPIYEAKKKCPDIICVLARHELYIDFHHRIQEEVERHVPIAAVCSIDEVACRLLSNENSLERATEIALEIKTGLARNIGEYVRCSIGLAPNRYLAKVATDLKKPDGLTVLYAHDLPARMQGMSLRDLPGIGHNMHLRLHRQGIHRIEQLWNYDAKQLRAVWGSIWGEKMWYYLRGYELPEEETTRSSIGHSHVLAPKLRSPQEARQVARRLTLKAASRLRRLGYYAGAMSFAMRLEDGRRFDGAATCSHAQDSLTFLHLFDGIWEHLQAQSSGALIKKVSVVLYQLNPAENLSRDLFSQLDDGKTEQRDKWRRMSLALDALNHRYGRDTVSLGMLPTEGKSFTGTKIAFTRIPDREEFLE